MKYPLRPLVFWPTFLILLAAVIASYVDLTAFLAVSKQLNTVILQNFSWLFSAGSFAMLVLTAIVYFSPLGQVRIGGEGATPLLSKWRWFMVALCTTLAVGGGFTRAERREERTPPFATTSPLATIDSQVLGFLSAPL